MLLAITSLVPRRKGKAPGIHCLRMRVNIERNYLIFVGEDGDDVFDNINIRI